MAERRRSALPMRSGRRTGEEAPADAKLPTDADPNMMAQKYFRSRGRANSRVGTWPLRTDTRTDSKRRITGSEPHQGNFVGPPSAALALYSICALRSELAAMNPPPLPVRKRFPWILYWIVLILIVLVALAPGGSGVAGGLIANAHGCRVDEGSVHSCVINGKDYGQLLYTLGVMGLLILVTLPAGAFAFVFWLIVLISHRANWRKRAPS